jgi:hypothetical protein
MAGKDRNHGRGLIIRVELKMDTQSGASYYIAMLALVLPRFQ